MNLAEIESQLANKIAILASNEDPAHDYLHFKRVVQIAKKIALQEKAKMEVVLPAAWLHDFVIIPKNDSRRKQASKLSAEAALLFLREINYPEIYFSEIAHAIEAHSFSANIEAKTIEAQIVQDADRLDGLGAIGLARCFATAGLMRRAFYAENDPFCVSRPVDDSRFTIDHFYAKLFKTADTLKTKAGRDEGAKRVVIMKRYLTDLATEV
ncbi:MAG: HD domain-containing protein [Bdellovibrionaceae bacterium]|nr:HD domain-containing protein [Bdellovibrio sp.]